MQGRTLIEVSGLKKIGQFQSSIQEIKYVPKGYNISYGKVFKTERETKVAVIPVGYMDGLNMRKDRDIFDWLENIKSIGIELKKCFRDNRLKVMINGKKYPILGRIGMYHAVVDITGSESVELSSEVFLDIPPMQVNSMIRREYF